MFFQCIFVFTECLSELLNQQNMNYMKFKTSKSIRKPDIDQSDFNIAGWAPILVDWRVIIVEKPFFIIFELSSFVPSSRCNLMNDK